MMSEEKDVIKMQRELEEKIKMRAQKEKQAIQNIEAAIEGLKDEEHKAIRVSDLRTILELEKRQYDEIGSLKLSGRNLITEMDELEEEIQENYISKEKNREKITELYHTVVAYEFGRKVNIEDQISILKQLLKEEQE